MTNTTKRAVTAPTGQPSLFRRLLRDNSGNAAIWMGLLVIPLVGAAAIGVDLSRAYLVKSRMSYAVDAAVLAGGGDIAAQTLTADVRKYFDANYVPGFMGSSITDFQLDISDNNEVVSVEATAAVPTTFARVLGFDNITVVEEGAARRSVRGMELVLIMDNTGSMRHSGKIGAMKTAAKDLVDILYGDRETVEDFYVGLVPYVSVVNVGFAHSDWTSDYDPDDFDLAGDYDPNQLSWKGCVMARPYPDDTGDKPPSAAPFRTYIWQDDSTNNWIPGPYNETDAYQTSSSYADGPNLSCPTPILELTAEKATIKNAIDDMGAYHRFGTMSNVGMSWGWRVISPNYQGLWGGNTPNDRPLPYSEPLSDKVAILLTDGHNQWSSYQNDFYTAYGYPDDGELVPNVNTTTSRAELNSRLSETCTAMKDEGVVVYTITFRVGSSSSLKQLYENCASGPEFYYDSPSNNELNDAFRAIGVQLSNLRLER